MPPLPHDDRIGPDRNEAHAPYNFVPLPDQVVGVADDVDHAVLDHTRHTGRIECILTTETPLYIRAGYTPDDYQRIGKQPMCRLSHGDQLERARFFHHGEQPDGQPHPLPVIPGSSLRGMLRNLVAIASASRVAPVNRRRLFYRTMASPAYVALFTAVVPPGNVYQSRVRGGFLDRVGDGWVIREVTVARIAQPNHNFPGIARIPAGATHGAEIHVACDGPVDYHLHNHTLQIRPVTHAALAPAHGLHPATLVTTGPMPGKHFEFVFLHDQHRYGNPWPIVPDKVALFESTDQITPYQHEHFESGRLRVGQPMFFLVHNNALRFIGRAQCFRLPYQHSVNGLLNQALPTNPPDATPLDLAEALFGYVRGEQPAGAQPAAVNRAGRVSVGDARLCEPQLSPEPIWVDSDHPHRPAILASPKPTAYRHYLVQTNNTTAPNQGNAIAHRDYNDGATTIRGHKLYWHQPDGWEMQINTANLPLAENETQHTLIRPVRAGVAFRFTIHYENLSGGEFGALLWALCLSAQHSNGQRPYRLKLGMGKPLGLGSVRLDTTVWRQQPVERYRRLFTAAGGWERSEQQLSGQDIEHFLRVFEQQQLARMGNPVNPQGQPHVALRRTPRIEDLLRMLRWPSPNQAARLAGVFTYRDLEGDFATNKRVLPVPERVLNDQLGLNPAPPANCPLPNAALTFGAGMLVVIAAIHPLDTLGRHPDTGDELCRLEIGGDGLPAGVTVCAVAWRSAQLVPGGLGRISGLCPAAPAAGGCVALAIAPLAPPAPAPLPALIQGAPIVGTRDAAGNVAILTDGLYQLPAGVTVSGIADPGPCEFAGQIAELDTGAVPWTALCA